MEQLSMGYEVGRAGRKEPEPGFVPDLTEYDWVVVSTSGGKDSEAMLSYVKRLAEAAGIGDRVVAVHADLGIADWTGTVELARKQAAALGIRFELCSRIGKRGTKDGKIYKKGEVFGAVPDFAEHRGMWPALHGPRWCTGHFKAEPIKTVFTALAREWRNATGIKERPCHILDCQGLRAEESNPRAKIPQLRELLKTRNQWVETWLPIQFWKVGEVWAEIKAAGLPHHRAYDIGLPRLSCVFCIYAPRAALVLAGRHNKELLREYVRVEKEIGHTFRQDLSLAEVLEAVEAGEKGEAVDYDDHGCAGVDISEWGDYA
jgi:3'-phosphoadenosine 5'-phosphosulfate sulfotransferase (PAPS reductase)/FAD synthetase